MAQRGINKVILIGNLGQDPEVRYSQNSTCFANLSLATSESWKDKQTGQQQEKTEWHRVSIIGKLAEIAGEYLRKGSKVYIEGKLQTRKWQGQDGKDNYTTEVVVDSFNGVMQMLDGKDGGSGQGGQGGQSGGQQQGYQAPQQPQQNQHGQTQGNGQPQQGAPSNFDDDIPFAPLGKQYRSLLNVM